MQLVLQLFVHALILEELHISRKNFDGKHLVLIGDSFRERLAEFAEKDFETATFIHIYNLDKEKAVEAIKNANVIVIAPVERYDIYTVKSAEKIIEILS